MDEVAAYPAEKRADTAPAPTTPKAEPDDRKAKTGAKRPAKNEAKTCSATVTLDKAENTSDPQALLTLVERVARAQTCATPGEVKLRISVDRSGKITKVVVVSGRREMGQNLVRKLVGSTSATRATSQATTSEGTVEVTLTTS